MTQKIVNSNVLYDRWDTVALSHHYYNGLHVQSATQLAHIATNGMKRLSTLGKFALLNFLNIEENTDAGERALMQRRIHLAGDLVSAPRCLILDEPIQK